MKQNLDFLLRSNVDPQMMICERVSFPDGAGVNYLASGREKHILHIILKGQREYIFGDERQSFGEHSVIFIPDATKYISKSIARGSDMCEGISVKFGLDGDSVKSIDFIRIINANS